jgi:hypothetical protein
MKNSIVSLILLGFAFSLIPNSMAVAQGEPVVRMTDHEAAIELDQLNVPLDPYDPISPLYRMGLRESFRNKFSPELVYAYTNYILRVASLETPRSSGDSLHHLGYGSTQTMATTLLNTPPSPARDRAVIIFWSFWANASINFYQNQNELHMEKSKAIERLGLEGKKLSIRALIEGNWVYSGFTLDYQRRDLFLSAVIQARNAGLDEDPEIRGLLEKHIARSLDFVTHTESEEKKSAYPPRLFISGQNKKSIPMSLAIQVRSLLTLGLPKLPGLLEKIKTSLTEPLFETDKNGLVGVDQYHRTEAASALSAQFNSKLLINFFENSSDLDALKKLFDRQEFLMSEYGEYRTSKSELLFEIETRSPGTIKTLLGLCKNEKERSLFISQARLDRIPLIKNLNSAQLVAIKTLNRFELLNDEAILDLILKFDLLKHDPEFAQKFFTPEVLTYFSTTEDFVLNRTILAILEGRLNSTQATFLAAIVMEHISESVSSLREAGATMANRSYSIDGQYFRRIFQNLTIATLFAQAQDLNANYLSPRMPQAKSIQDLLGDLYDGSRERGARFDDAADLTKNQLFIAVAKALRSGQGDPDLIWDQDLADVIKRSSNPSTIKSNAELATAAVRMVTSRINSENLAQIRTSFAKLVDKKALANWKNLVTAKKVKSASAKGNSCRSHFSK